MFDTYETEYDLLHRPLFAWNKEDGKDIPPGQKLTVNVNCYGKVGWYVQVTQFKSFLTGTFQHDRHDTCVLFLRPPFYN